MSRQTSEIVYEVLRWNFGRFVFRPTRELPPVAVDASLGLSVDGILMEGFRRVGPHDQLSHVQAGHDGLARSRIVSEYVAQRLAR